MLFLIRRRTPPARRKRPQERISGGDFIHLVLALFYTVFFLAGLIWGYDKIMELGVIRFLKVVAFWVSLIGILIMLLPRFGERMQDKDPRQ